MALVSHQRCNVLNGGASSANGLVNVGGAANGLAPNAALINGANGLLNNALLNGANGKLLNGAAAGLISGSSGSCNSSTSSSGNSSGANSADSNNSLLMPKHSYQNAGGGGGNAVSAQLNAQPDRPIGYGAFGVVWAVTDPRTAKRVALKKMPNVFQNLASCKRVFREIKMLCSFKHDNVISCLDVLQPSSSTAFQEIYVLTELMQSDLHKIIVSPQPLTTDHVKVFMYQILRGVSYLHSANIVHRDIKPGNLLVNSNCLLKICDFGLARFYDGKENGNLTHEVVTQYYRAPELLMGARKYTFSVDTWSVGCIFAEILGRRILFQAQGPVDQLNMIIDLLGSPPHASMKYACDGARSHVLKLSKKQAKLYKLDAISPHATRDAIQLLTEMLRFDPDERTDIDEALRHPYLEEGRIRFHSCMCTCCFTRANYMGRAFCSDLEPKHKYPSDVKFEKDLARMTIYDLRDRLYKFITERWPFGGVPLCINVNSANFKSFSNSSVAQPSELPPSPHAW